MFDSLRPPWTVAHQTHPSMEFSRQEFWSELPFPSPGDLPNLGIEPGSPALQADSLPSVLPGSLPTTQEKTLNMDITRWPTLKSDWLHSLQPKMEKLYTVSKNKTGSSDHEVLIAKFRLKLKKVGKTTTPFRYDLSQIPYDYIVEVKNRFRD